jgi:excisionase family DNA binding protein
LASLEGNPEIGVLVGDSLIFLTPDASKALRAILEALLLSRGGMVRLRVSRDSATLTPEQVARDLGVSRPFVYKLLDRGELPFEAVGTHRRVPVEAVSEYLNAQQARVALADEIAIDSTRQDLVNVDLRAAAGGRASRVIRRH